MTPTTGAENPSDLLKNLAGADNKIIDKKEFKKAEDIFKDNYADFMAGSGNDVLALFDDAQLQVKIDDVIAKGAKKGVEKLDEVDKTYLVLKAIKGGKIGDYASLLKVELGNITLEARRLDFKKIIEKDKDLSDIQKSVLYDQLDDEFLNASTAEDPVKELGEHFGLALGTIKTGDKLYEGMLKAFDPDTYKKPIEDLANIFYQKGLEVELIVENTYNKVKNKTQENINDMLSRVESIGEMTKKNVLAFIDQKYVERTAFSNWCSDNRTAAEETYQEVTIALLEAKELAWNTFADGCLTARDNTKDFFEERTTAFLNDVKEDKEKLIASWNVVSEFCSDNREKTQTFLDAATKALIEGGNLAWDTFASFCIDKGEKIGTWFEEVTIAYLNGIKEDKEKLVASWNVVAEFCSDNRAKAQTVFDTVSKLLIEGGYLARETFANFCTEKRETMKESFATTVQELIVSGILEWNTFTAWCTDKRETIQTTVAAIAKGLYEGAMKLGKEVGTAMLKTLYEGLIILVGTPILVGKFIIEGCGYIGDKLVALGTEIGKVLYDAGVSIADVFTILYENIKGTLVTRLNQLQEIVGDAKTVFNTLYALGKIKLNEGLNRLSLQYNSFVDMRTAIQERKTVLVEDFTKRVGESRQLLKIKTAAFGKEVADFVGHLIAEGIYKIEQIGAWFVGAGESIGNFFNQLIKIKGVIIDTVYEWFLTAYNTAELAIDKLFALGIGSWDQLGEILYDAGVTIEVIAKMIYTYLDIAADKVCDFCLGLYNGAVDKIDKVVDAVAAAVKEKAVQVKDRAYGEYLKTMDSAKAAIKALDAAKERVGTKVTEMGNWLLSKGVSAINAAKTLYNDLPGYAAQVGNWINGALDTASESVAVGLRAAADWFSDLVAPATTK